MEIIFTSVGLQLICELIWIKKLDFIDCCNQILKKVTDVMRAKRNIHKTIRNDSCKIKKYVFSDLPPTKEKTAARIPPMYRKSRLR